MTTPLRFYRCTDGWRARCEPLTGLPKQLWTIVPTGRSDLFIVQMNWADGNPGPAIRFSARSYADAVAKANEQLAIDFPRYYAQKAS